MPTPFARKLRPEDYTVAWLCAKYDNELQAALCMLDEEYHEPPQPRIDENAYWYGAIQGHNVVIACMTAGKPGLVSATSLVQPLQQSFPNLDVYLFVGIGGGIPRPPTPIREDMDVHLGDVVVRWPKKTGQPALVAWDMDAWFRTDGKSGLEGGGAQVEPPSNRVLNMLTKVLGTNYQSSSRMPSFDEHIRRLDRLEGFGHPGIETDRLYKSDHSCQKKDCEDTSCGCDDAGLAERPSRNRSETSLLVHRGTILSGNSFVADAELRDKLRDRAHNAHCFEMEAAGIVPSAKALVIRGISDYADSHVNREWQKYAAGIAAAFARGLICAKPTSSTNAVQEMDKLYPFRRLGIPNDKYLNHAESAWDRLTVQGLSIYEEIYARCSDERGCVHRNVLKEYFPYHAERLVSDCWKNVARNSEYLHHGMTLAVIYLVHLRYYGKAISKEVAIAGKKDAKHRRCILRRYATWVSCTCDNPFCPCLWNFANRTGLCRNLVKQCRWVQVHFIEGSQGTEKEVDEFFKLREVWISKDGDPLYID